MYNYKLPILLRNNTEQITSLVIQEDFLFMSSEESKPVQSAVQPYDQAVGTDCCALPFWLFYNNY